MNQAHWGSPLTSGQGNEPTPMWQSPDCKLLLWFQLLNVHVIEVSSLLIKVNFLKPGTCFFCTFSSELGLRNYVWPARYQNVIEVITLMMKQLSLVLFDCFFVITAICVLGLRWASSSSDSRDDQILLNRGHRWGLQGSVTFVVHGLCSRGHHNQHLSRV